jgi:hypothetical protein
MAFATGNYTVTAAELYDNDILNAFTNALRLTATYTRLNQAGVASVYTLQGKFHGRDHAREYLKAVISIACQTGTVNRLSDDITVTFNTPFRDTAQGADYIVEARITMRNVSDALTRATPPGKRFTLRGFCKFITNTNWFSTEFAAINQGLQTIALYTAMPTIFTGTTFLKKPVLFKKYINRSNANEDVKVHNALYTLDFLDSASYTIPQDVQTFLDAHAGPQAGRRR